MASAKNYGSFTLQELRQELGKRQAKKSGKKADLVKRLEFYDRNKNFGFEQLDDDQYYIATPARSTYKDVNADTQIPKITLQSAINFLTPFGTTLGEKVKNLYKEKFLFYVRVVTSNGKHFAVARCAAEMKKSVSYEVDVVVDKEGVIVESQCECAVGTGPTAHCKHVKCLLFALISFSTDHHILSRETCTQRLQTFHQCRPFKGSPLKASRLQLRPSCSSVGGRDLKQLVDSGFDPRPPGLVGMASYKSFFSNACINFQASMKEASKSIPMPILQAIPPANIYGVANDHDYLEHHPEVMFLEHIEVSTISDERIQKIEHNTREQSKSPMWRAERCKRLTASNFGRICKCTDRTDRSTLARSFIGFQKINSEAIRHGIMYEDIAVLEYEKLNLTTTSICGLSVSKSHPFIASTPDRVVDEHTLLEVKCPYSSRDKDITPITVPYLQEVNGELSLKRNHDYFYQIQGQMLCTHRQYCHFVVYSFKDMKVIIVERDESFIQSMVTKLTAFHNQYFKKVLLDKYFYKDTDKYSFEY